MRSAMLGRIIDRCQMLAGHVALGHPLAVTTELRALIVSLPPALSMPERLMLNSVFGQLFGRLVSGAALESRPDVARALVCLAVSTSSDVSWRQALDQLLAVCALLAMERAIPSGSAMRQPTDVRARRALAVIDAHYTNPDLALADIALALNRSVSQTGRLLKRATGEGFVQHLRRRRVRAAQVHLRESSLTLKEIAFAVGFRAPSRLSRDFARVCGVNPKSSRLATDQ